GGDTIHLVWRERALQNGLEQVTVLGIGFQRCPKRGGLCKALEIASLGGVQEGFRPLDRRAEIRGLFGTAATDPKTRRIPFHSWKAGIAFHPWITGISLHAWIIFRIAPDFPRISVHAPCFK